jgi:hypothetical protein
VLCVDGLAVALALPLVPAALCPVCPGDRPAAPAVTLTLTLALTVTARPHRPPSPYAS